MRIGLFSDTFLPVVDGVGRVVHNYALALGRRGEACYVVAPMADTGYRGGYPFELVDFVSMELPRQRQYSTGIPQLDPHYDLRMRMIELDVIHAHSPFIAGMEALRLGRKRGVPVIGTFHSRYYDDFYKLTKTEMLASIAVRSIVSFYDRCDEVWTVSQSSAETLHDYGYEGEIVVMPNGTPDVAPNPAYKERARAHYALPDVPIFLYCGQLNWKKNLLRTLESCARLKCEGAEFALALAGQGPDVQAIKQKAAELELTERTILTGHVTDETLLYGLYQNAALFVFPSLYDTSGMVVREAAAMETPSVTVRNSAAAEPIEDRVNGYLCEDESESLCAVMRAVLNNPASARRVGKEARKSIYLSWDDIAADAAARYAALADRFSRGRR